MVCPYAFSRLHRGGWFLCIALYSMALVCAVVGFETVEERTDKIILCMQVYFGMIAVIELLAWWIRKCWLDGIFQSFTVDVRMASCNEEDARDIMYNMAVWPVIKAHNMKRTWYAGSIEVIAKVSYLGPILAMIATVFA